MRRNNFFTCALMLLISVICTSFPAEIFSQTQRYNFTLDERLHERYPITEGGYFSISNVNGDIRLESWDNDEVDIEVRESGRGDAEIEIEIYVKLDRIEILTRYPRRGNYRNHSRAHYIIKVPKQIEINARTVNGHVDIVEIEGRVEARSTNGDVLVSNITGDIRATTTNGNIEIIDTTGDIIASTVNQSIVIRNAVSSRIRATTTNGSIRAEFNVDENGDYDYRTTNGSITVYIPDDSKVDFEIRCRSRQLRSDFDFYDRNRRERNRWSMRTYSGNINGGGASLSARTSNGNVNLRSK